MQFSLLKMKLDIQSYILLQSYRTFYKGIYYLLQATEQQLLCNCEHMNEPLQSSWCLI